MRFLLYCNQDPRDLGIEDKDGNWDIDKFKEHIRACPACVEFTLILTKDLLDRLERAFKQKKGSQELRQR